MANDPNRDLLPVKETSDKGRGQQERTELYLVSKIKRPDLEDRYIRLLEQNIELKKKINEEEDKNKRLGTKLLRSIYKKNLESDRCKPSSLSETHDEMQMKILNLEHENYKLRDKNTVLRQQLASHARQHGSVHRSSVYTTNTPRISNHQTSTTNLNESTYSLSNRQPTIVDNPVQENESQVQQLNEEIKNLHKTIETLQQEMEECQLEDSKCRLNENIDMISLKRSLNKQMAQCLALQDRLKQSELQLNILHESFSKSVKENEELTRLLTEKEKQIMELQCQVEHNSMNLLEFQVLKERVEDLLTEREVLRKRCSELLETLGVKTREAEDVLELKKNLLIEKTEKEQMRKSLETLKRLLEVKKGNEVSPLEFAKLNIPKVVEKLETSDASTQTHHSTHSDVLKLGALSVPSHRNELSLLQSARFDSGTDNSTNEWASTMKTDPRCQRPKDMNQRRPRIFMPTDDEDSISSDTTEKISTVSQWRQDNNKEENLSENEMDLRMRYLTLRRDYSSATDMLRLQSSFTETLRHELNQTRQPPSQHKFMIDAATQADRKEQDSEMNGVKTVAESTLVREKEGTSSYLNEVLGETSAYPFGVRDENVIDYPNTRMPVPMPRQRTTPSSLSLSSTSVDIEEEITITIHYLKFTSEEFLSNHRHVPAVFVQFKFLNFFNDNTESPQSLDMPTNCHQILDFNFSASLVCNVRLKDVFQNWIKDEENRPVLVFYVASDDRAVQGENDSSFHGDQDSGDISDSLGSIDLGLAELDVEQLKICLHEDLSIAHVYDLEDKSVEIGHIGFTFKSPPDLF